MTERRGAVGWLVSARDREALLKRLAPAYPDLIAHHVTLAGGISEGHPLPPVQPARVVGVADDGRGVQALVVELGGTTRRPDGSTYHITWSLDQAAGRTAVQSNDVIRERGWTAVEPFDLTLTPGFWPS